MSGVVVSSYQDAGWLGTEKTWLPRRGDMIAGLAVPTAELVRVFTREFREARRRDTDSSGYMPQWGWQFPITALDRLESSAEKHGYRANQAGGAARSE